MESRQKLYFIGAEGVNFIKVGISLDPEKRLKGLSSGSPYKLKILKVFPDAAYLEKDILEIVRERMHGEWFVDHVDLDALVLEAMQRYQKKREPLPGKEARNTQEAIGFRMRELRKREGMSQEELAERARIPQEHISRYERGKWKAVNPDHLIAIAEGLRVSVDELVCREASNGHQPPPAPRPRRLKGAAGAQS